MGKQYFGTDGIRGRVGEALFTPEFVMKLGWAAGRVLSKNGVGKVLIGKDTRISGYMFESALEAGLSAAGVDIELLGPMPTPAVAYLTRTLNAVAGVVISASHNPYYDNGIKFFSSDGTKLSDEIEFQIEAEIGKPMVTVSSDKLGKARRIVDARGRYIELCKSTVPSRLRLSGLKIVIDCANGATYHVAPSVFRELGADVIELAVEPDGLNINDGCGSTHIEHLQAVVLDHKADLGIALDGDGDRVIMVDHKGEAVDGDEIIYIIARSRQRTGQLDGAVVGTLMSNLGLETALSDLGLAFERVAVGDRYVMQRLQEKGWVIGGESSGHILCLDRCSTGDGIIAALQVVAEVVDTERTLNELKSAMNKCPQKMINVRMPSRVDVASNERIQSVVAEVERRLAGTGRVLLRASGTEPVVRVMIEGQDIDVVISEAESLAVIVKEEFDGEII